MKNQWIVAANEYHQMEVSQQADKLPIGIYNVEQNPMTGEIYLAQTANNFEFGHKIYGLETGLIERVARTYANTNGNLGMLLNGVKGTGKTVTSKQVANKLQLPVLVVNADLKGLPMFINSIQQDIVVMIDEYEKIYKQHDSSVLTVMDGVLSNGFRRVFLLTTNSLYINENLLQRPGRLRYLKTFSDLTKEVIEEIVDDTLIHKELRDETVKFISQLQLITVDIVLAIVKEVNIHKEAPSNFADVFNVKKNIDLYEVRRVNDDKTFTVEHSGVTLNYHDFTSAHLGKDLWTNGYDEFVGKITEVFDGRTVQVEYEEEIHVNDEEDFDLSDDNDNGSQPTGGLRAILESSKKKKKKNKSASPEVKQVKISKKIMIGLVDNLHKAFNASTWI